MIGRAPNLLDRVLHQGNERMIAHHLGQVLADGGNGAMRRIVEDRGRHARNTAMVAQRGQQRLRPVHWQPGQTVIQCGQMAGIPVHHLVGKGHEQRLVQRLTMDATRQAVAVEGNIALGAGPVGRGRTIQRPGGLVGRVPEHRVVLHLTIDDSQLTVNGGRVAQVVQGRDAVAQHHVRQQLSIHPHARRAHGMRAVQTLHIAADHATEAADIVALHRIIAVQARGHGRLGERAELEQYHAAIDTPAQGMHAREVAAQRAARIDDGGGQAAMGALRGSNQDRQGIAGQDQGGGTRGCLSRHDVFRKMRYRNGFPGVSERECLGGRHGRRRRSVMRREGDPSHADSGRFRNPVRAGAFPVPSDRPACVHPACRCPAAAASAREQKA